MQLLRNIFQSVFGILSCGTCHNYLLIKFCYFVILVFNNRERKKKKMSSTRKRKSITTFASDNKKNESNLNDQQKISTSPLNNSRFPKFLTSDCSDDERRKGLLISVHMEIYENLRFLQDLCRAFTVSDMKNLPDWLYRTIITSSRKTHRSYPFTKAGWVSFLIVLFLAFATRLYDVHKPDHICWDETHFGKFANHYLNGTFFFDVHPPLGKMLLALAGWASGYDGSFPFDKPGDPYGEHKFVGMRMFCALLGAFCIPLAYLIVWELTHSLPACILTAALIIFDHGSMTISQYILLDPILMFFMMMSVYSLIKFYSWRDCPFSFDWWGWMFCTGYFLACTFSVKWVGLFVILFSGITTIQDLWDLLGDLTLSIFEVLKHFIARVIGLILLPVMVYLFFFGLHFQALPYSGPGDGFFSSALQSTLQGNQLYKARLPAELAYGSVITLKNHKTAGALLHSHQHLYPAEHPPEQQQITGYSHKDENNNWLVNKPYEMHTDNDALEYIKDGDLIRLMHVVTRRNLHSHPEKAPLSTHLQQVSGYGENGWGDANDIWKVKVTKHHGKENRINTVKTIFRLIHVGTGCALTETDQLLPKWGWEQKEMACNPNIYSPGTEWNVEQNEHKQVPEVSIELLAPSFLESVYESHIIMAKTNNGFKPKEGEWTSQAWHWPINYRGQVFSGADYRIYLLGNPIIWWLILATFGVYVVFFMVHSVRNKRGYEMSTQYRDESEIMIRSCAWLLLGWALHYFPFYAMGRVLYFHHYFPAYLFSAMFSGILLQHLCRTISLIFTDEKRQLYTYYVCNIILHLTAIISFIAFRGLSYGMSGPMGNAPGPHVMAAYRWLDSWDI